MPGLRGHVQGRDALAVVRAAERPDVVHVGAEVQQRPDRVDAAGRRRPGQGRAAVDVGVDVRAALDQRAQGVGAVVARGPGQGFVLTSCGSSCGCQAGNPLCGR